MLIVESEGGRDGPQLKRAGLSSTPDD